ncbi:MAG: hypothetical protein Q9200_007606, partial [Gallowayella weberi]
MLHFEAAPSAIGRRGRQVKRALDPDDRNWYSSSACEYAALAGEDIPDKRWIYLFSAKLAIVSGQLEKAMLTAHER